MPIHLKENPYQGIMVVMVYRVPDEPITRIELLSPSNKTTHQQHYRSARHKTL